MYVITFEHSLLSYVLEDPKFENSIYSHKNGLAVVILMYVILMA